MAEFQLKPEARQRLQELATANGKTVEQAAAMTDGDLATFVLDLMLENIDKDPETGVAMLSVVMPNGVGGHVAFVRKSQPQAADGMTEERKKQLMGHLYRPPAATK